MNFWTNLSSIIQIPASIAAILGLNAFEIIRYYRKHRHSAHHASTTGTQSIAASSWSAPAEEHALDWLDLAMALLIGGAISLFVTFIIVFYLRIFSYVIVLPPYHSNAKPLSLDEALHRFVQLSIAVDFSDLRFDIAFIIGLLPGTIIGAWNGRSVLRTLAKGKGLFDWFFGG